MDLSPLDLVLAVSLASATVFFAALPTREWRKEVFQWPVMYFGLGWWIVAFLGPKTVLFFPVLIGAITFYARSRFYRGEMLAGKGWMMVAAALGIGPGVVFILKANPRWNVSGLLDARSLMELAIIYTGGAVVGLAVVLTILTRRKASEAGVSSKLVEGLAQLLMALAVLFAVLAWLGRSGGPAFSIARLPDVGAAVALLLPILAWLAQRRANSPAPSTSGIALLALATGALVVTLAVTLAALAGS